MGSLMKTNNGVDTNWMFPRFPSLLDDFFSKDLFNWSSSTDKPSISGQHAVPAVNVRETDKAYMFEMAAPGMDRKDFKVELINHTLTISSKQENQQEDDSEGYTRKEFSYRGFSRSFDLPSELINSNDITARYHNGILLVVVPKSAKAQDMIKEIKVS